ncbi:phosphotransferase family protein [Dietzia sp. NPDC055343]
MSSDTVLVDATWNDEGGTPRLHRLVARLAPLPDAMPVFPRYDFALQAQVMRLVAEQSTVPVPHVFWHEESEAPLGREFLIMDRVDGLIPVDVMPYNFEGWVYEATAEQRATLQRSAVRVLADLHSIAEPWAQCPPLARTTIGAAAGPVTADQALRAHVAQQRAYYEWASDGGPRSPLIERALDQLDATKPTIEGDAVLCCGDSRIGNIVFRDFRPAAVLDWEMVTLGPRELDLGWMIFLHRFFEDIAAMAELPGLPDLLRRADVAAHYSSSTGHEVRHLDWFITYAALRQAVIMYRIQRRTIAFGAAEASADPDDMIMHRASLEAMLAGTYWTDLAAKGL